MSRAAVTSTVDTLDLLTWFKLILRYPTYTETSKVSILWLDTPKTAKILISRLLPFGYQQSVSDLFIQAPFIKLPGYRLVLVVQVKDVPRLLMVNPEDGPTCLNNPLTLMCLIFN